MPKSAPDALRYAVACTESALIAVEAELDHARPDRWPGTLDRIRILVAGAREAALRTVELLEAGTSPSSQPVIEPPVYPEGSRR